MNFKHHIRMTASEIAMGRYMRAPDHPTAAEQADQFGAAFADLAKDDDKPAAGAAGAEGGAGDDGANGSGAAAAAADDSGGGAGAGGDGGAGDGGAAAGADGGASGAEGAAAAGAADGGDGKDPKAGEADGGAAAGAADDKSGKGKAPAAADTSADDVLDRLAAAVAAKKPKADEGAADGGAGQQQEPQPILTAEDEAKIEHFRKEWPEVAEAFDLQMKAAAHSVIGHVFKQIGAVIGPMRETVEVLASRTHMGDLREAVGEYSDEERDAIVAWVEEQPTYLQEAMKNVITGGTVEEVADLVGRYRKETGKPAAGAATAEAASSGGDTELSGAAKQAAAALAPVGSKRSGVVAEADPADFGAAFDKFLTAD